MCAQAAPRTALGVEVCKALAESRSQDSTVVALIGDLKDLEKHKARRRLGR